MKSTFNQQRVNFPIKILFLSLMIFAFQSEENKEPENNTNNNTSAAENENKGENLELNEEPKQLSFLSRSDLRIHSTECLSDAVTDSDFIVDLLPDSLATTFLLDPEDYKTMKLEPLYNALENDGMISFTKFANSRNFDAIISFLVIFTIFSVFILIHSICGNDKKFLLIRKCCFVILSILVCLLAIITFIIFVGTWTISTKAQSSKDKMICEATRIPLTLLQGNPEIEFDIKHQTHFLGLENLREWTVAFLKEFESFVDGKERIALDKIQDIDLKAEIEHFERVQEKFYSNFAGSTVPNESGQEETPISIIVGLEFYNKRNKELIESYKGHAEKVNGLTEISHIVNSNSKTEDLKKGLEEVRQETLQMENDIVSFWNDTMESIIKHSSYTFKIAYVIQILLTFIMIAFIAFIISFFSYCARGKKLKLIKFLRIIGFIICFLLLIILGLSLELNRTIYTAHYGCGFAYQMKHENHAEFEVMISATKASHKMRLIGEQCLFKGKYSGKSDDVKEETEPVTPDPSPRILEEGNDSEGEKKDEEVQKHDQSLFNLYETEAAKESITNMLNFLNGLKMTSDDSKSINREADIFETNNYLESLNSLKKGFTADLPKIAELLIKLNNDFQCSDTYYAFTKEACPTIQTNRSNCIEINARPFLPESCIEDSTKSRNDFNHLFKYFQRDETLVADLIQDIESLSHSGSIMARLNSIWDKNDFVIAQIESIESTLVKNFDGLGDGDLFQWLDCTRIKDDIDLIYNDICVGNLKHSMAYVDLLLVLTTLSCVLVFFLYLLTMFKIKKAYQDEDHQQMDEGEDEFDYEVNKGEFDTQTDNFDDLEKSGEKEKEIEEDNPYYKPDQGENLVFKNDQENQKLDQGFYKAAF